MQRKIVMAVIAISVTAVLLLMFLLGCSQDMETLEVVNAFSGRDCSTPVLVSVQSDSSSVIRIEFNEPVKVYENSFEPFAARSDGKFVYVQLNSTLEPGTESLISGRVRDYYGNTTGFSVTVWGYNPAMPEVLINEFTSKGTEKSPDRTELLILEDGNINGMTIYNGVPDNHDAKLVMGDVSVKEGDMVVIWWTENLPQGIEEHPESKVFNFCSGVSDNLPSNNGVIVLCDTPSLGAHVLDAVVYSNFSASYNGYGTKNAMERADWAIGSGIWVGDAVDSTTATATRSISRTLGASDTDTARDWYVTVTSGSTFGSPNTSQAY